MDLTSDVSLGIKHVNGADSEKPADEAMDVDNIETLGATPSLQENSTKLKTGIPSLPPETLVSILLRAIPPYALLDTTLSGEKSAWCQTLRLMRSVVLVCHMWYDVGRVFLYEDVCIRRCNQLEFLTQTLTSSLDKNLSSLVKSLTIQCYIPKDKGLDFRTNLEVVIGCCTSLSTFAYNAAFVPPAQAMTIRFPAYITHFRLGGCLDNDSLLLILMQLNETLLSLDFVVWDSNIENSSNSKMLQSPLSLPLLHSLSVTVTSGNKFGVLNILGAMPSLQKLTVARSDFSTLAEPRCDQNLQTAILSFLALHGRQLRQLHIGVSGFRFEQESFKQVLNYCPLLERIILHPSTFLHKYWTGSNVFFHPNLRSIDLTYHLRETKDNDPSKLCLFKENLPALECVRRFCDLPCELLKWLDEYPPNAKAEKENFVIGVFRRHLDCQEGLFVWRLEPTIPADKSGQDPGYFPTSSDEWDSSSSSECEWTSNDDLSDA